MIGLVLVTHGRLADEFRAALEHVMGPQKQIEAVTIGADDDSDLCRSDIIEAVNRVDTGDGVAILTDMFGGTPSNLAISCNGGHTEHCGHYKDNKSGRSWDAGRFLPPHDPETVEMFEYLLDGSVQANAKDPRKASYLIEYLGLDCSRLTDRRRAHARNLIDTLGDQPDQALVDWLRQEYLQADGNNRLKQFYSLSKQMLEP